MTSCCEISLSPYCKSGNFVLFSFTSRDCIPDCSSIIPHCETNCKEIEFPKKRQCHFIQNSVISEVLGGVNLCPEFRFPKRHRFLAVIRFRSGNSISGFHRTFFQFVGVHKKFPDDMIIGDEMCWLMEHRITSCKGRVTESCQNGVTFLNRVLICEHQKLHIYHIFFSVRCSEPECSQQLP